MAGSEDIAEVVKMKPITYLQEPNAAEEFLTEKLFSAGLREHFPSLPFANKRGLVLLFLIGPETERFAAEPVYGPTGKGFLKSKGVEGLLAERKLQEELESPEGTVEVSDFLRRVEALL